MALPNNVFTGYSPTQLRKLAQSYGYNESNLDNFGKFFDDATTSTLESEIARRSNSSVNNMLKNAMLLQLAQMYKSGKLVVVNF